MADDEKQVAEADPVAEEETSELADTSTDGTDAPDPFDWDEEDVDLNVAIPEASAGGDDAETEDAEDSDEEEPKFTEELLNRAEDHGISKEDAEAFTNPAALEKVLDKLDAKAQDDDAESRDDSDPAVTQRKGEDADDTFKVELDEITFDPELIDVINGLNDHVQERLAAMQDRLDAALGKLEAQEAAKTRTEFDELVEGLGDQWHDVFGKGRTSTISPRTKAAKARAAMQEEMATLKAGYESRGRDVPSASELFQRALHGLHRETAESISKSAGSKKTRNRQGQFVARPTSREGAADADPTRKAISHVAELMAQKGIDEFDTDDYDGF